MKHVLWLAFMLLAALLHAQKIEGVVYNQSGKGLQGALLVFKPSQLSVETDSSGFYSVVLPDTAGVKVFLQAPGYQSQALPISQLTTSLVMLVSTTKQLDEIAVVTDREEISKSNSAFSTDILDAKFFQKTSCTNLFEASALIPGVRAQVNCNVCNTGEIRINGMDGPYTLILIDNVPIVSGLSSVYGLMGIPASLLESVEVSKGPSAAFYGAEAMAGVIALTTKPADELAKFSLDYSAGSYFDQQLELSAARKINSKRSAMAAMSGFWYNNPVDINKDNFTDISLQKRISGFFKTTRKLSDTKQSSLALRAVYEDRWGGEMNWQKKFRLGDSLYGESIYIKRAELLGHRDWNPDWAVRSDYSIIYHHQDAAYGTTSFIGEQTTAYVQTHFTKTLFQRHKFSGGHTFRYLIYDDNTAATQAQNGTKTEHTFLNGLFLQHEIEIGKKKSLLLASSMRFDWHSVYGGIPTPRFALKYKMNQRLQVRFNAGTGYRIVNVFTEDHAALSGARNVVFVEAIKPERSLSGTTNVNWRMRVGVGHSITWDFNAFYYHFYNKILPDYSTAGLIVYQNLKGYAFSRGASIAAAYPLTKGITANASINYTDVQIVTSENGVTKKYDQWYNPKFTGILSLSYSHAASKSKFDLSGTFTGKQRMPIQNNDYRAEYAEAYSLLNLQISKVLSKKLEVVGGIKNMFDFLPIDPLIRAKDPFNKTAEDAITNPNGYTFDTTYNYAPMQRRRYYIGLRLTLK